MQSLHKQTAYMFIPKIEDEIRKKRLRFRINIRDNKTLATTSRNDLSNNRPQEESDNTMICQFIGKAARHYNQAASFRAYQQESVHIKR